MRTLRHILLRLAFAAAALAPAHRVCAQYYSWGADPARFRWMRARTDSADVIYPEHTPVTGLATLRFVDVMNPYISYGYRLPALDIPFVVHPENMRSNGLVMWLPKRVEFLSAPAVDSYSMPWIKQLVAHEYRHAVQYNNLNVGLVKVLGYLLGQQSSTIGLLYMPLWMIEGDATMSETEVSSFGRGRQPRFTIEFRAMGDIVSRYRNTDRFFCGSYRDFIPDHYRLGYQLVSYGNERTGEVICDRIAAYGPRHPWMVISTGLTMRKLFGFTTRDLFRDTFRSLYDYWSSLPAVEDSAVSLPAPPRTSYTVYSHPIAAGGGVLMLKEDLDRPSRFVMLDPATGAERTVCYTGEVSTRPAYDAASGRVWWTEYRRSAMFQEKVESRICFMDQTSGRPRTLRMRGNLLYPTPDGEGGLAWAEYAPDGIYTIVHRTAGGTEHRCALPFGQEVHSLAWDDGTRRLYCILTGDEGMWIAGVGRDGTVSAVTRPAYITLSSLRAGGGRLYFGSIASGRDEAHCYDLGEEREYQLTESTYGSFDPAPAGGDSILLTTYDSLGYRPSAQPAGRVMRPVEYSALPRDVVNPPRRRWNTINLDTVRLAAADTTASPAAPRRLRRYRKAPALLNFHSWAPLSFDPFSLSEEGAVNFNLGATVMTQNLLSTAQGFFTYGWSDGAGSVWKGSVRYCGLGPTLTLNATYGGRQNIYPVYTYNPGTHAVELPEAPERGKYYSVGASLAFPLMFQRGYHTRHLTASAAWNYSNGLVANTGRLSIDENGISNVATIGYNRGLHLTSFSLGFQDMVRMAHRDFLPPWGAAVSATYAMNPADGNFSDLVALYARVYTPGVLPHNSFSAAVAYQTSIGGFRSRDALSALTFRSTKLLPRGFDATQIENRHYMAASLNYQFPICYPDGGWRGIAYFKRIRANLGFDIAQFRRRGFAARGTVHERWHRINSWGGDLTFDANLLNQPASATVAITLSLYRPSEGGLYFSAGMDLPF